MNRIILSFATLGMLAAGANALTQDDMGCYQIGTSAELFEFAGIVNADEGADKSACGILTADITVNENVLTEYSLNGTPATVWNPLAYYHGVFDGKHHTISGLYATGKQEIGFFGALANGKAVVRNLNIADSYFAVDSYMAGGITGNLWDVEAIIDSCSFDGVVTMTGEDAKYGNDLGGIVGNVSYNSTLVVSNSTNKGKIGYGSTGWNMGTIVGLTQENGDSVSVVASLNNTNTGSFTSGSTKTIGSTAGTITEKTSATAAEITAAYGDLQRLYSVTTPVDYGTFSGVKLSYANNKLIATLVDSATTLSISNDLAVDSVAFTRKFLSTKSATMALPFAVTDMSTLSGATFYELTGINKRASDEERDTINGSEASSIVAYKPYVIAPAAAGGSLQVSGAVALKSTSAATLTNTFTTDWDFITAVSQKRWDAVGSKNYSEGNNVDEIGRVYGFAGSNPSGIAYGNFVRAVTNVAVNPLRAYLKYTGTLPENCSNALCKPSAELEPSETIVFRIVEPVIAPEEEIQDTTETQDSTAVEPTDSFQKITPVTGAVKADRWFDMKGRALNKKPTTKGTYINNHSVVIIK